MTFTELSIGQYFLSTGNLNVGEVWWIKIGPPGFKVNAMAINYMWPCNFAFNATVTMTHCNDTPSVKGRA